MSFRSHRYSSPSIHHPLRQGLALALLGLALSGTAQADSSITLGAGVGAIPRYEGSSEYKGTEIPIVNARIGPFYARTDHGVGINLIETPTVTLSAGVNMMWGYDSGDMPHGIDGLSDEVGARLGLSTRFAGAIFRVAATQALKDSDRGLRLDARIAYPFALTDRVRLVPSVATSWASEKYMDSYFGITADESRRSGLAQYQPTSGFKDVSARMAVNFALTERFNLTGTVNISRLVGEAAGSPLVEQKNQVSTVVGASYTF
ncbi:MAG TPA: MipA/OmpV family protein [Castellaniella sp.]|uniref:MipA/OmpV family protein n=1 Tax=Castellaniella sp. TaxID=1955812 RepID=UPI002EFE0AE0